VEQHDITTTDREAWLAWRKLGVGASDAPAILGLSRWSSPWSVWADKVGLLPEVEATDYMEFGLRAERMIADWFAERTGHFVTNEQRQIEHPVFRWARATIDGEVQESADSDLPLGNLEIKTTGPGPEWEFVPADYVAQCRWQQYVGGYERTWVAVLMGRRLDIHVVERDPDDIAWMAERVAKFWSDHVLTGIPPEVDGSEATTAALAAVYGEVDEGSVVDLPPAIEELAADFVAAKAAVKEAEVECDEIGNNLRALLGEHEVGLVDGRKVVSWKSQGRTGFDLERLRAEHPQIAEQYQTTSTHRVLRTHLPKEQA